MTNKVRTPQFSTVINRTLNQAVEMTLNQAYDRGERLRRGLGRLNSLFYRTMAQLVVASPGPPNLGGYTPSNWVPLTKRYTEKKGNANFYQNTEALKQWLYQASAADILGPPTVILRTKSERIGEIEGFQRTIVRTSVRGKRWIQTLTFADSRSTGIRGFIRRDQLLEYLQPRLQVVPFSTIPFQFSDSASVADWLTGGQSDSSGTPLRYKFLNVKGRELRPIVSEYLGWWIETRVKRLVDRFGKVT